MRWSQTCGSNTVSLLVRKIDKGKWLQTDICAGEDVSADAITNCMKTTNNNLSVWKIESENKMDEAVLAMVSAHDHLETIDIVPLNREYLREKGIDSEPTIGLSHVEGLRRIHHDLCHLSYRKLGLIAYHIVDIIREQRVKRYTAGRLKEILGNAVRGERLKLDDLSQGLRKKVEGYLLATG